MKLNLQRNHRHTFALAPLIEWNGSGSKILNCAYGVRSEWNLDKSGWTWNTMVKGLVGLEGWMETIKRYVPPAVYQKMIAEHRNNA